MAGTNKIGIIICDRYKGCAGGKCFRSLKNHEGAFSIYGSDALEVVGYTSCGGCPGGNIEYAGEEMLKNGAQAIHLATGLVVGYPPCPHIEYFKRFLEARYSIPVVIGTHPIPEKYYQLHGQLGTWKDGAWKSIIAPTLADEALRKSYN
ncbi:MAG TPA: CGGC domain-containing protein [Spirochaetaceae bacterium]|jgi:predicted metal-binding protein|nr:CGGC domain-containing protein [Spirochaetaceae bacterium]